MASPTSIPRLKQIFSNDEDGWEDVVDYWEEVAPSVLSLVAIAEELDTWQRVKDVLDRREVA